MVHPEHLLQKQVCTYLRYKYSKTFFMSDTIANMKLTIPQKVRNKAIQKEGFHCPDLLIFECKHGYGGLFFELKSKSPYKKDGTLYADEHLENQCKTIIELQRLGYYASFEWDIDTIIKKIDWYLN